MPSSFFATADVNILRDPRWGRGQETPGEDPTLSSSYAEHFVTGMQGTDPTYLKVSAGLKHFSVYSQETGRVGGAVVVTPRDMEDTYLPAFVSGISKGNASGLMCSKSGLKAEDLVVESRGFGSHMLPFVHCLRFSKATMRKHSAMDSTETLASLASMVQYHLAQTKAS